MPLLYYCDHYAIALPEGHKFPMVKYRMVRDRLNSTGLFHFECAPMADAGIVALAHDAEYVRRFINGTLEPAVLRRIGFPWSEGLVNRTLASVGGDHGRVRAGVRAWLGRQSGGRHASCISRRRIGVLRLQRHGGGD